MEDLISRQAAKRALEDRYIELQKRHDDKRLETNYCLNTILELPSVNPQKIGHWIENAPEYQNIDPPYICSECGNMHLRKTNYCDQCGAQMIEPQESEE